MYIPLTYLFHNVKSEPLNHLNLCQLKKMNNIRVAI